MSQGNPPFPPRTGYSTSSKLPDRTAFGATAPQQAFGTSAFARRPDQSYQYSGAPVPPQHGAASVGPRATTEKEPNALSDLSEEQREELNEAFQLFDLDRDRHIDYHELRVALRSLGFSTPKTELAQILHTHGTPKSSASKPHPARGGRESQTYHISQLQISHAAYIRIAAQKVMERDPAEEVERAYVMFDPDRKGYIALDDLRRISRELGENGLEEEEMVAMIEEFDYDGTGFVSREAFFSICLQ